jgi:hypothetical protein
MQEAVLDRPPFGVIGVIRGAMGGVWLCFLPGRRRKVEKMGKVTKKRSSKFSDGNFWRLVKYFWPPPFQNF